MAMSLDFAPDDFHVQALATYSAVQLFYKCCNEVEVIQKPSVSLSELIQKAREHKCQTDPV